MVHMIWSISYGYYGPISYHGPYDMAHIICQTHLYGHMGSDRRSKFDHRTHKKSNLGSVFDKKSKLDPCREYKSNMKG